MYFSRTERKNKNLQVLGHGVLSFLFDDVLPNALICKMEMMIAMMYFLHEVPVLKDWTSGVNTAPVPKIEHTLLKH